jgi:hypothetical protein
MEIKIKKKDNITSVIFESSNREFKFADVDTSKEINTKEKMTFLDMVKSLYMAGKKDDVLFIEQVGEDE